MSGQADQTAKALQQLAARRDQQSALFRELNTTQSTYDAVRAATADHDSNSSNLHSQQEKLRDGYQRAYLQAAEELKLVSDSLAQIKSMLKRRERKTARPSSTDGEESSGYLLPEGDHDRSLDIWLHDADHVLPIGSEVAALVDGHSVPPLWIQCAIKGYRPGIRPKYEVLDLDPGDQSMDEDSSEPPMAPRQKRYILDARKILPLPSLVDLPMHRRREFAKGERVIGVFPTSGITTLYPAEVVAGPSKRKNNTYLLRFDDDEDVLRGVSAQYVAPMIEFDEEG